MSNKKKLILSLSGVLGCILLIVVFKYILDSQYRNNLPEYPDFQNVPIYLQEQISDAGQKAYYNPGADNLGRLGMVYYSSAYSQKASKCYQLAVKKDSSKWIWSYYLGYLNLEQGESNKAIENFKHVLKLKPDNYLALFYTADAYQNLGSISNAENIFKKISDLNESDFVKKDTIRENDFPLPMYAKFRLARIYMNSNRLDSAKITLAEIIKNQMTFGPAYRLLGSVYTKEGNIQLGNKYTIRANDLVEYTAPADILLNEIALISRSDTYLLKQIDDAVHCLNFKWSLKLFDHALKYIPDNKFLISKAMYGYFSMGYNDKAMSCLDKHFKYFSDDFNELFLFATILNNKGYTSQAMKYFNQAKMLKPGDSKLVLWLSDRNMTNEAVDLLSEQLKKEPENAAILSDAVRLFSNMGDKEQASKYMIQLKRTNPSGTDIRRLTGEVEENNDNLKEAVSNYEEVIKSDPKNMFSIKHLANIYAREKSWEKLIRHYRLSLENNPNEPYLLEGIGSLLISCPDSNLININDGREYSERAYINFKSTYGIKLSGAKNLAIAYLVSGDKKKANEYINLTINLAKQANVAQDYILFFDRQRSVIHP